jgi:hypothetical protein
MSEQLSQSLPGLPGLEPIEFASYVIQQQDVDMIGFHKIQVVVIAVFFGNITPIYETMLKRFRPKVVFPRPECGHPEKMRNSFQAVRFCCAGIAG